MVITNISENMGYLCREKKTGRRVRVYLCILRIGVIIRVLLDIYQEHIGVVDGDYL